MQISESGLGQLLTKRLTTPGNAVAPAVAPELMPMIGLEVDRPEWGFLKGELRYGAYVSVAAAGAGQYARIYLRNPSDSRLIITLEQFSPGASTGVLLATFFPDGLITPTLATQTRGRPRDTRQRRGAASGALVEYGTDGTPDPSAGAFTVHYQLTTEYFKQPIVIAPGGALEMLYQVVNTAINVVLQWRERPAEPGELV